MQSSPMKSHLSSSRCGILFILIFVPLPLILAACYNFTTIDVPSAFRTIALGINNAGYVVGSFDDVNGTHGFVRDTGGNFTTIDFPNASSTEAHGINDRSEERRVGKGCKSSRSGSQY